MTAGHPLVLVGAGGSGREAVEVVRAIGAARPSSAWHLRGFLDDGAALQGRGVGGVPVLGPLDLAHELPDVSFTLCTGSPANPASRCHVARRLGLPRERYASVVHPSAVLPGTPQIGVGCLLQAGVVATVDVAIGDHVLVMPGAVFTHDDVLEDFVTVGAGVRLAGGVRVGAGAYLGSGVLVREGVTIGAGALIGMGSVVLRDVPPGEIWCGNPARRLRPSNRPPDAMDPVQPGSEGICS